MKMQIRWLLQPILILTLLAVIPSKAYAAREFLYTNDNEVYGPNTVTAFSIETDGTLKTIPGSPFRTGAKAASGYYIGNADYTIRVKGDFLFVSNDDSVSVFTIAPASGALSLIPGSPFEIAGPASGYGIALAVSPNRHFLFAGDVQKRAISVFTIDANGSLALLPGSPFDIGGHTADMKVTSGNKFLIISLYEAIGVYRIFPNGKFTPIAGSPFPVPAFGIDVNCSASLLFAGDESSMISVLNIAVNGSLTPIPGSPFAGPGVNFDTVALNQTDTFLYVNDALEDDTVGFSIARNGRLILLPGSPFRAGAQVTGLLPDEDGKFLFVAGLTEPGEMFSFTTGPHGYLNMVSGSPFQTGQDGNLTSLATFPGKTCP
jgi:6-phosphogluconolactonase (cycloisomerase 2 family)